MGLDMYVKTSRYQFQRDWNNDDRPHYNGWPQTTTEYEAGYWRKHAPLHNFIVRNFADDGIDDCSPISLSPEVCRRIAEWLRSKSWSTSEEDNAGFFFGSSDWWEELKSEADEDAAVFEKLADWLEVREDNFWRSAEYQASW